MRQLLAPELGLARPRDTIAQAIIAALREQLPFDRSCVVTYDQQMSCEWFYLGDLPPAITQDASVRAYYRQLYPRPDLAPAAPRREWLAEPVVMLNDRTQLACITQRSYPILNAALRAGLQESLLLHLCVGGQPVGGVCLYSFRAGHFAPYAELFPHLRRLLEPVAIGLSNGVAYEALQAAEQEKAIQPAFGQALTSRRICPELFAAGAQQAATLIPWHSTPPCRGRPTGFYRGRAAPPGWPWVERPLRLRGGQWPLAFGSCCKLCRPVLYPAITAGHRAGQAAPGARRCPARSPPRTACN